MDYSVKRGLVLSAIVASAFFGSGCQNARDVLTYDSTQSIRQMPMAETMIEYEKRKAEEAQYVDDKREE